MSQTININNQDISVEQFRNDWALALMSQGVIVKLAIGRWRANAKLTPEILGLKFADQDGFDFTKRYLSLGQQKLLPPEIISEIDTLECRARQTLDYYSFETVWGRFVPFTAFKEWQEKNEVIYKDFMEQAIALGNKYDDIISMVREEYRTMAKDVWVRLYSDSKGEPTLSFVENFVDNVVQKIPSREKIVESFKYSTTFFIIPMPSFVAENIALADQIKRQEEMAEFESELEKQTKAKIKEEYVKRKKELIDRFLESTVNSMRSYVAELCNDVLISIGKTGKDKITVAHINRLKNMIKKIRVLNFYNDEEISDLIKDLNIQLGKFKSEINQGVVIHRLKQIVDISKKEYSPKSFNPSISILEI